MPDWLEPQDVKSWMVRGLSFRGMVVFLAVMAMLLSELRFNWVEVLVGRYLAVTNIHRPESGSVWEQGRLREVATQTLEQMVTQQLTAQREAREATSLTQLIQNVTVSQGTMISATQFKTLYSQIPEAIAPSLFSPVLLLRISAEKSWERVYLERENGQVGIYLLDRGNNVLSYTTISDQQLTATGIEPPVVAGTLDEQTEFSGRIYPADRFFMALDTLGPETQRGVLSHPGALLAIDGVPLRVGFSDEVNAEMIRIGIEMDTPQGLQVVLTRGQEWAVWQVRTLLEPSLSKPGAIKWPWSSRQGDR